MSAGLRGWLHIALLAFPCAAQAATPATCPWLSVGTAQAVLGDSAEPSVQGDEAQGVCLFIRQDGRSQGELRIAVDAASEAEPKTNGDGCTGERAPVRGIGGSAYECSTAQGVLVAGVVRRRAFRVILGGVALSPAQAHDKALRVAEQVAGALF